jgi:transcription-repair coupling factor (superfamily II helicase)
MPIANPLHPPIPHKKGQRLNWGNLSGASVGLALSSVITHHKIPIIIVTPDTLTANRLTEELAFFSAGTNENPIISFPDWETLPYDHFSPHQDIISGRLSALYQIPRLQQGVVITPISTLMQRLTPKEYLDSNVFLLKAGDELQIDNLRLQLEKAGYRCVNQVREHGEFAVRGSIIDLFPMGSDSPFRLDLFDNEIDSIRLFSTETQRSTEKVEKIELLPAKEFPLTEEAIEFFRQNWRSQFSGNPLNCPMYQDISEGICTPGIEYYLPFFFEKTASFFDYVPASSLIITIGDTYQKAEEYWREIDMRFNQYGHDVRHPLLAPQQVFINPNEIFQQINAYANIRAHTTSTNDGGSDYQFTIQNPPILSVDHKATKPLASLENYLKNDTGRILFTAETTGRREVLLQLFNSIHLHPKSYANWQDFLNDTEKYGIAIALLDEGLTLNDPHMSVIAESQLFGKRVMQRRRRKETVQDPDVIIKDLSELQIGAPIVHIDHGVGRYLGLQTLNVGEQVAEFLMIEYADETKLYVPVSSLHFISRYSGMDAEHAPLHRLGTEQWQRAKRKAAEQVRDVAAELLEVYAHRAARPGFACDKPDEQYTAFANAFPFEETPDQQHAIDQILIDMQSDKPMDRLVCGDVGFGKTEVAMRAAFMAVQNGKQVAILVPTTLLAQQHYQTFLDRFADWPFQIDVISRFKTTKDQQKAIARLEQGKIDIIIGTHKLLNENIKFKSLGLLIIDEEHRFGVQQKERMKALRSSIDILTLTATPIPRTLNMAFSGIRDLSLIATPPAKRLAVKTFVQEYHDAVIQEAIQREIMRGGQVYFLHNDVATIERMTRDIETLIPEARASFVHGQMRERELEQVMSDFYHRRFNVLVCSTIVESGIDIPSANTIIINRADKLGLAQLHQLRGRVGRSHHQAYAYLLIPSRKLLTGDAEKRLDAIAAYEDLGIGFTLATHDLEIRGAGELLGEGQSGNMHAIGFTLYMDLLSRAVNSLKAGKEIDIDLEKSSKQGTEIDLQIPALIPEKYLGDVHLRLQCYKRISSAKTSNELDDIQVEMIDRFGLLSDPAKNLFAITLLKQRAELLGIIKIEANSKGGKVEFSDKPNIDPLKIIKLIQTQTKRFRLEGPTRLRFNLDPHEPKQRVELVENILSLLSA